MEGKQISPRRRGGAEKTNLNADGDLARAEIKCSDLLDVPNRLRIRWEHALNTSSKNNWLAARQQLDSIHTVLWKAGPSGLELEERENVYSACVQVRTIFVEEQAMIRRNEDRGHNGR
jgi:hypothetical protein